VAVDEEDADRQQHLVERTATIEIPIESAFEDQAERGAEDERERQPDVEVETPATRGSRDQVATRHREHPVREVDEAHQAHRDREADRDEEQQHPVGDAVEEDAERIHGAVVMARYSCPGRRVPIIAVETPQSLGPLHSRYDFHVL